MKKTIFIRFYSASA